MALRQLSVAGILTALVLATTVAVFAQQTTGQSLGSVRIPRAVAAEGGPLQPGTYTVRTTGETVQNVVGQTPEEHRWVEFVQSGNVRGKALAIVLTPEELAKISEGGGRPGAGSARVEVLKGDDYVRVWINRSGTHYLIYLSTTGS